MFRKRVSSLQPEDVSKITHIEKVVVPAKNSRILAGIKVITFISWLGIGLGVASIVMLIIAASLSTSILYMCGWTVHAASSYCIVWGLQDSLAHVELNKGRTFKANKLKTLLIHTQLPIFIWLIILCLGLILTVTILPKEGSSEFITIGTVFLGGFLQYMLDQEYYDEHPFMIKTYTFGKIGFPTIVSTVGIIMLTTLWFLHQSISWVGVTFIAVDFITHILQVLRYCWGHYTVDENTIDMESML